LIELCSPPDGQINGPHEYYTPPDLVTIACSSVMANTLHDGLLAEKIYTLQDNGLEKEWNGNVFYTENFW
jgi:hypothetical protein